MEQLQETSSNGLLTCLHPSSHALLLPYPAQGHINPLMQLGKRLASQGVRVTVAIIENVHAKVVHAHERLALSSHPLINDDFQILAIKDGLPQDFDRENRGEDWHKVVDTTLAEGTLELVHTLASQGRPVTCIVGDFFLRWTWAVAERAAVPEFIFWPQCASVFSIYLHVDAIISSTGYDPYKEGGRVVVRAAASREASPTELIACIPGLPTSMHPADLPFGSPFGKFVLEWMGDVFKERFSHMGEAHGVIGNSFEALEPDVFKALTLEFQKGTPHPQFNQCWPRSIRLVGPLVPQAAVGEAKSYDELLSGGSLWEEEVEECKQWLDLQPSASVLFVAFGSITLTSVSQVQELALGLAASGHKFLWVVRHKAITATTLAGRPPAKVESVALEEALPEGFLEQNQHLCKVVRWAPQALVLSHPSVGGFFSHCGWNSTLESLCCGVPLLGWPWLMDQVTNCWLVSHVWKVGITLERDEDNQTCRKYVESGVRQLMEGTLANSLREKTRELRALARAAAQRSDSVLSLVEDMRNLAH